MLVPTWRGPAAVTGGGGGRGRAVGGARWGGGGSLCGGGVHISAGRKSLLQTCDALIHVCTSDVDADSD